MSIIRGPRPSDNYAQIHNAALADGRLSFKARGLLAYLLSRPPGWKTSVERLATQGRDGEAAIKSAMKELEQFGYLRRHKSRTEAGTFEYDQEVTDVPATPQEPLLTDTELTEPETTSRFSTSGLSTSGKPPSINNTEPITLIEDGVVVNSPTPVEPRPRTGWWPSPAALASAQALDPITDIPISVTRYRAVKYERKAQCDSGEWLRWFLEDEKKARSEERKNAQSRFRKKNWYDVAE